MFTFNVLSVVFHEAFLCFSSYSHTLTYFQAEEERSEIFSLFLRQLKQHTQCNKLGKKFSFGNLNRNVYLFVLKCCIVCTAKIYMTSIHNLQYNTLPL